MPESAWAVKNKGFKSVEWLYWRASSMRCEEPVHYVVKYLVFIKNKQEARN